MTNYYTEHDLLLVHSENLIVTQDSSLLSLSTACMVPVYCPCMMNIIHFHRYVATYRESKIRESIFKIVFMHSHSQWTTIPTLNCQVTEVEGLFKHRYVAKVLYVHEYVSIGNLFICL